MLEESSGEPADEGAQDGRFCQRISGEGRQQDSVRVAPALEFWLVVGVAGRERWCCGVAPCGRIRTGLPGRFS